MTPTKLLTVFRLLLWSGYRSSVLWDVALHHWVVTAMTAWWS